MITNRPAPPMEIERIAGSGDLLWFPDHLARYLFAMQFCPGARILDVCCGVGYGSFLMAGAGAVSVEGLDVSEDAIREAARHTLPNLRFRVGDACQPYGSVYDLITCFEGIEHVRQPAQLLQQVYDALGPNGVAVLSTPNTAANPGGGSQNPYHLGEMTQPEFQSVVEKFSFAVEWYAQIGNNRSSRPAWMKALIRALRLRKLRSPKPAPQQAQGRVLPDWPLPTNLWYPLPWKDAVRLTYDPPPTIMVAVCRKTR
jgi:SAM-dependent methyltransferase